MTSIVPHQALYRRWRAQTFSQIVGQDAVVETLRNAVRTGRVSHAVLFVGPRGTGKTSLARILAKALNCTDLRDGDPCDACAACVAIRDGTTLDLVEIDAASNRGIDDVRELRERLAYPPGELRRKVYILDEAHQITGPAWNALLKSIEEPPPFVAFMFASTEPSGFPAAILSRLQRFDVRRLTVPEIEGKLTRILDADEREADPGAVRLIARLAAGGMRDAESMLDQLLSSNVDRIDESHVRELLGLADAEAVEGFVDALVRGDAAAGIGLLDQLEARGRDARMFLDQVVEAVRGELMAGLAAPATVARHPKDLVEAARRLATIDPNRAGIGGLRLQLELALLDAMPVASVTVDTPRPAAGLVADARPAPTPSTPDVTAPRQRSPAPTPSTAPDVPEAVVRDPAPVARLAAAGAEPTRPAELPTPEAPQPDEAAPPSSAVLPSASASAGLDELIANWPAIVARVSLHPPTKPLIVACRPVSVEGSVVTLGFPEEQAFLKDVAERKRTLIEQGIGEALGRDVAVRCVVANVELVPVAAGGSDDGFLLAEARRIFADDLADVDEVS